MIPDAAVAHLVYLPDFAFEQRIVDAIEAATQDPDVPRRTLALLAKSLRPRVAGPWKGSRASGICRCERALVFEAFRPGETLTATTILTFGIGHFVHAVLQAHFPGAPAEESWRTQYLTCHSDQRFIDDSRIVDYKTSGADGWLAVRLSGRPKNEHAVQATIYAVAAGCEWVTVLYLNKNGVLTRAQRASREWKAFKAHHEALGMTPNELLVAYTFRADARIARGADSKALRIRDHVATGTLPAYAPYPEMLRRGGECQYCPVQSACAEARAIELEARDPDLPAAGSSIDPSEDPSSAVGWQEWFSKVVGTTFVPGGVDFDAMTTGDLLDLEWEPENPHGPRLPDGLAQAVRVIHRQTGAILGHLPSTGSTTAAKVACHLRRLGLRDGRNGEALAEITDLTGGTEDKANRGINVRVMLASQASAPSLATTSHA